MSSHSPFDKLSDDIVGNILSFCDFPSAVSLTWSTCSNLRKRFGDISWNNILWQPFYERHRFVPVSSEKEPDYLDLCRRQRQLLKNLVQPPLQKKNGDKIPRLFSLPSKRFSFLPVVPQSEDFMELQWDDPPPVFYECDSFVLSCGDSPEMLFLDPYDGSLKVFGDIKRHISLSEGSDAMNWEPLDVSGEILGGPMPVGMDIKTTHRESVAVFPSASLGNTQCLLAGDDCFEIDLAKFFPYYQPSDSEEFEMSYVGIESKPIWGMKDGSNRRLNLLGNMVAVGRCVVSLDNGSGLCTELSTWTRFATETGYGHRRVCRFGGCFRQLELDACHNRLFVSYISPGDNVAHTNMGTDKVFALPLVEFTGPVGNNTEEPSPRKFFPQELFSIQCEHPVATFACDATGSTLLICTQMNTLEVWKLGESSAYRLVCLSIQNSLKDAIRSELVRRSRSFKADNVQTKTQVDTSTTTSTAPARSSFSRSHTNPSDEDNEHESSQEQQDERVSVLRRQLKLPQFRGPIKDIYLAKHLLPEQGFVTFHHSPQDGSSLLLWQNFQIVSLIHLRLSPRRKPQVHFDGNRIVVLGQDHIGCIILVYQILGSEFQDALNGNNSGEASGGVYDLKEIPAVRFANRIRHVALDGIEGLDSMQMACNDRFIVANTRTGNHLGTSPFSEGLLVIDLED